MRAAIALMVMFCCLATFFLGCSLWIAPGGLVPFISGIFLGASIFSLGMLVDAETLFEQGRIGPETRNLTILVTSFAECGFAFVFVGKHGWSPCFETSRVIGLTMTCSWLLFLAAALVLVRYRELFFKN